MNHPGPRVAARAEPITEPWRGWVVLVVVAILLAPALPAAAATDAGAEDEFVTLVNRERAARQLPALRVCTELRSPARSHSKLMADTGELHHNPDLRSLPGWQRITENVGRGATVASIHGALMDSAGHRANILDPRVTQLGIGVERTSGLWVTQVFREPSSGAACTTPDTAPEPTSSAAADAAVRLEGDFTGSGRMEVATYDPADGRWRVGGAGALASPGIWGAFSTRTGWSDHLVGDVDGDGRDDVVSYHPGAGTWWLQRSTGTQFTIQPA
jgi:hypothetical protein